MLVLHPKDKTTELLSLLYVGEDTKCFTQLQSGHEIERAFHHCPKKELIMLLGHGSERGLFSRENDTNDEFDRIIVGHPQTYYLRKHGNNVIGIWCHADLFARKEGLHGLFSGMIISDRQEAESYGIITLQHYIDETNEIMFRKFRKLLDEGCPLCDIPCIIKELRDTKVHNPIAEFNYESFYYL